MAANCCRPPLFTQAWLDRPGSARALAGPSWRTSVPQAVERSQLERVVDRHDLGYFISFREFLEKLRALLKERLQIGIPHIFNLKSGSPVPPAEPRSA